MTARRAEALALLAVAAVFWGYYAVDDAAARRWLYYAGQGALLAAAGLLLRPRAVSVIGLMACTILMFEGGQQALCGALHIGWPPVGDACIDIIGAQPYEALLSAAISALIVRRLRRKHSHGNDTPDT